MSEGKLVDGRPRGWFHIDNHCIDVWLPKVGPIAWSVYTYLVRKSDPKGVSFPSYSKIAESCGVSRPTAMKAVEILREHGLIEVRKRGTSSNVYVLQDGPTSKADSPASKGGLPGGKAALPTVVNDVDPINTQVKTHKVDTEGVTHARASHTRPAPNHGGPKRPVQAEAELPAGWWPTPRMLDEAGVRYPDRDLRAETERFVLWHGARKTRRADWNAEWWLWLTNPARAPASANGHGPPVGNENAWEMLKRKRGIAR